MSDAPAENPSPRQRLAMLNIMVDFNHKLLSAHDLETVEENLFEAIALVTGAEQCVLVLVNEQPMHCRMASAENPQEITEIEAPADCPVLQVIKDRTQVLWNKDGPPRRPPLPCPAIGGRLSHYIGVPLIAGGELVGVIEAVNLAAPANSAEQAELLATIGASAGQAIRNARR